MEGIVSKAGSSSGESKDTCTMLTPHQGEVSPSDLYGEALCRDALAERNTGIQDTVLIASGLGCGPLEVQSGEGFTQLDALGTVPRFSHLPTTVLKMLLLHVVKGGMDQLETINET